MKFLCCFILALCSLGRACAQDNYAVSAIDPVMLKHANMVMRHYELKFQVLNKGEAIETEHVVLTLLNDQAADENVQAFWYDQIQKIEDIDGAVYSASGKLVRKIKKQDITDQKPFQQVFVDDNRAKVVEFPRLAFPYTIEYTVVTRHHGLMHYPVFEPQHNAAQSVELANFEIVSPAGLPVRIKEINVLPSQKTTPFRWEFRNLPAFEPELFLPVGFTGLPRIMSAPTLFSIEGYDGDMSTWESYGKFISTLNAGKANLPAETVTELLKLTADCPDLVCKAQRVYEFLQKSTRYYYVGMGIGGWQPMPANEVDKFKYSDCKGLSNYTVAMLQAVGVPAYYALIRATAEAQKAQTPDFPNPWFNHATLCIPTPEDTLWLECTSQNQSFGFLSDFTDDRLALVVFPEGGKIVQTPHYDETVNTILRETTIELSMDGSAKLQSHGTFRAIEQDIPSQLADLPDELRKKYLYKQLNISDFEITALSLERKKDRIPAVAQALSLNIPKLATVSGKRLFLPSTFLSSKMDLPILSAARQHPVQADGRGKTEEDSVNIAIPEGYTLENVISPLTFHSVFGSFEMSIQTSPGLISVHRKLILNNSIQPKEKFEELLSLLKNVAKADQMKLVLVH